MVSEYTGMIFRIKYLESVLRQDISWFEENDPQSLASKIDKESSAIQIATGEKAANIFFSFTMLFAGVAIAFILGWKFTLVMLGLLPLLFGIVFFMVIVLQMGYKNQERAFKKSSTLAEQALSSIKIVAAFGKEEKEEARFSGPLEEARTSGIKYHFITSIAYSINNGGYLIVFGLTLLFGAMFVHHGVNNDIKNRDYTPGDIVAIFYGIMFAAFSLGIAGPNFKSLTKGRQAAH